MVTMKDASQNHVHVFQTLMSWLPPRLRLFVRRDGIYARQNWPVPDTAYQGRCGLNQVGNVEAVAAVRRIRDAHSTNN